MDIVPVVVDNPKFTAPFFKKAQEMAVKARTDTSAARQGLMNSPSGIRRAAQPTDEVAELVAFLVSDTSLITVSKYVIDGRNVPPI